MLIINGIEYYNQLNTVETKVDTVDDYIDTEIADIKKVTDKIPDGGEFTTEYVKTAGIKTETDKIPATITKIDDIKTATDKIGTISNAGGTATIGGVLGAVANSSIVARLNNITTETDKIPAEVIKTTSLTTAVGTKADAIADDTVCARLLAIQSHLHARDRSYPYTTAGVTLTGGSSGGEFGSYVEIVPVLANEVNTMTITHAADSPGNVVIDLNGKKYTCPVTAGTTAEVAAELRALDYEGYQGGAWVVTGADSEVIFTRAGLSTTATFEDVGTTGVTVSIAKTSTGAGINKAFYITSIQGGNANVKDTYIIELSSGLAGYEQRIGNIRVTSAAINSSLGNIQITSPELPTGTRIIGRIATLTGGTDTLVISINYHVH